MTFASRLLHASSLFTDSFATPSAMMRKILGRLELSGPRTMGLLLQEKKKSLETISPQKEGKSGAAVVLPLDEVAQEVKRVHGLLLVLVER